MNAPVNFDLAADADTIPLDQIDVTNPRLYQDDVYYPKPGEPEPISLV